MVLTTAMPLPVGEGAPRNVGESALPAAADVADAEARRLARAVARGDEAAFRQLYDQYQPRLFRMAVVLGRGDEAIAQEVVQATLLTVAARLKAVAGADHLWNWLARVARQHLAKAWRQRERAPIPLSLAEVPEPAAVIPPDAVLEEHLDAALLTLDAEDRQVIGWFYFEDLSHKEIAERLDTTPKAVASRLERARARLRSVVTRKLSHET